MGTAYDREKQFQKNVAVIPERIDSVETDVDSLEATTTNQASEIAKKGFAALEAKLNARVDRFIDKYGQFLYVDRVTTNLEKHTIDDLILCGKSLYKSTTNVYSETWSEGCTIASVSASGLTVSLLNGTTPVTTYTYSASAILRSIGNTYDSLLKDKIIRRIGSYSTQGKTFTSADVLSTTENLIKIKLPIDIDMSIPLEYRQFMVQGIKVANDSAGSGVFIDDVNNCLYLGLGTSLQLGSVAGANLLEKANTWLATNTVIVIYKKQEPSIEAVSNNVFTHITFTGDLNYTTSDANLNPSVIAKVVCSRDELKDFLFNHNGVSYNGQLSRRDGYVINAKGKPVQLRGIGTHYFLDYEHMQTLEGLRTLKYYGVNVLRITAYTVNRTYIKTRNTATRYGAMDSQANATARMDELIAMCRELDMYCIIDWHNLMNELVTATKFVDTAKTFFTHFSSTYPNDPLIIYELLNEPMDQTDANITSYCTQVAPTITANSPNAMMICGIKSFPASMKTTYDTIQASISLPNLFMSPHFYVSDYANLDSQLNEFKNVINAYLKAKTPFVVSEWGNAESSGDGVTADRHALMLIRKLGIEKVSWCMWKWTDQDMTTAFYNYKPEIDPNLGLGGITEEQLTHNGKLFVNHFVNDDPYYFNG